MNFFSKFLNKTKEATLVLDRKGISTIGGKAKTELDIPKLETSPLVYFGCVSKKENLLNVIDFDLSIFLP